MRVRYIGPFAKPTGYAQAAHDYLSALKKAGVELDIWPIHDAESDALGPRYEFLLEDVRRPEFQPTHVIVHTIPRYAHEFVTGDLDPGPDAHRIAVTTWETDTFPDEDAERLAENFDLVVVPSRWNQAVFDRAGLEDITVVVPHAFNPTMWWPGEKATIEPFYFYSVGVWSNRKNLLGLLIAYLTEFTGDEPVVLRLLAPYFPHEEIERLVSHLGLTNLPEIDLIDQRLTGTELHQLHDSSHCYVSAARGEGFGLGAFEAALMGNAVITTQFGGQTEFLADYERFMPCRHILTPAVADVVQVEAPIQLGPIRVRPMGRGAPVGIAGNQNWAEPDLVHMKELMRWSFDHRHTTHVTPLADRQRFTYEAVGTLFRDTLDRISRRRAA